jgi:hypothetical protein
MFQQLPPSSQHKIRKLDCLMPLLAVNRFPERLVAGAAETREPARQKQFPLSIQVRDGLESIADVLE